MTMRSWFAAGAALLLVAAACRENVNDDNRRTGQRNAVSNSGPLPQPDQPTGKGQGTPEQAQNGREEVTGIVRQANGRELVITPNRGGSAMTLRIGPQTTIHSGEQAATISQLQQGVEVRVSYQEQGGGPYATDIVIRNVSEQKKMSQPPGGEGGSTNGNAGGGTKGLPGKGR